MSEELLHGELTINFSKADQCYEMIKVKLTTPGPDLEAGDLERVLHTQGLELMRLLLEARLNATTQSPPQCAPINPRGTALTHQRNLKRKMTTIFGDVKLKRQGRAYFENSVVYPCDAHLNLPNLQYSHEVQKRVTSLASTMSFGEASIRLGEQTAAKVVKRSVEVVVQDAVKDFETFGGRPVEAEKTTDPVVMSFDHTGVVMHGADLKEATAKRAEKNQDKRLHKTKHNKGQPHGHKRMACVGAIYTQKPAPRQPEDVVYGLKGAEQVLGPAKRPPPLLEKPRNKRLQASLKKTTAQVMQAMFEQATQRDPTHVRPWIVLVDGSPDLERQIMVRAKAAAKHVILILDFIHVLQYLWKAADALNGAKSEETEPWVLKQLLKILEGKVSTVAAGIRRSATTRNITGAPREVLDTCADYLLRHKNYMKYNEYLEAGWPIATGVIEGACRHLVKDRMDLTGARWRLKSAEAVLQVRALHINEQWEEYWHFHETCCKSRNYSSLYLNGFIPPLLIHLDNPTHLKVNP